ncbi:MAG: sensor histidine kinase [Bacteroidota bacterium]
MGVFSNREARGLLGAMLSIFGAGIILTQVFAYINALEIKNGIIRHDYELAGYLQEEYPEAALTIPGVFTAEKTARQAAAGRVLLARAGYGQETALSLMPLADRLYRGQRLILGLSLAGIGLLILLATYLFLRAHYRRIEAYIEEVRVIADGGTPANLRENEEGSLSKLAASIRALTATLRTHIEKEKQSRIFLKYTLTNVSHQLKTPLAALMMYTEIMQAEKTPNDVITGFLAKTWNELERMQTLIANLLKLARLDAGVIVLNRGDAVINEIVLQAVESFQARLRQEQKAVHISASGRVVYACDREWMLEALSNLVKNAVEHTAAGDDIAIVIEETPLMVRITIRDNGEGIHPDDISHIFKRFYRSKYSQRKQGTGIGLALAKTIVEMHDGFITVESAPGRGAVFTVNLPRLTKL